MNEIEIYKSKHPFSFLPGHRALIIGIGKEIVKLQQEKKGKTIKSKSHSGSVSDASLNEDDLKISLINQISTYAFEVGFNFSWSDSIEKFNVTKTNTSTFAQSSVACPLCQKTNKIRFEKKWLVSNMYKHIRSHIKSADETGQHTVQETSNEGDNIQTNQFLDQFAAVQKKNYVIVNNKSASILDGFIVYDEE